MTVPLRRSSSSLFDSVPKGDPLNLFKEGGRCVDGEKIVKILEFKKKDVSLATNIPAASIRFDEKMPTELMERFKEWAVALNLVAEFFQDPNKAILWFDISNPLLGDLSPRDMIKLGRFKKLRDFIQTALDENKQ